MAKQYLLLLLACLALGTLAAQPANVLADILKAQKASFGAWAQNPAAYEIQVIYTQIDRDAHNRPSFTEHRLWVDTTRYFYPASTVKMPAALLALEKLQQLGIRGLDSHTPLRIGAATPPQTPVVTDPTAANLLPSVAHYLRKVFLVSDNDAFNRLYEFLGQRYFNEALYHKGYTRTRLTHRLSAPGYGPEANQYTNPVTFYRFDTLCYYQGEVHSRYEAPFALHGERKGVAYLDHNDELVQAPFDFSFRNFISLPNLHHILRAVIFPEAVPPQQRFHLSEDDYQQLYRAMYQYPSESDYPAYEQPDNYVKFWMYGDQLGDSVRIPPHIRILNKVGVAYGYLTDVAYIIDLERKVEFLLSATIHVNANQTYNDGIYEYDEVGMPFFGELGRAIYEHELKRPRQHLPDLSRYEAWKTPK